MSKEFWSLMGLIFLVFGLIMLSLAIGFWSAAAVAMIAAGITFLANTR